ncbi:MAG: RNA-binding protein [Phototrophicales bacterium]|nr:MAG: RNA-binding protein [Phototrophicales bacterium]RMG71536.1 MAG: KH domain-containing protein [Chloroflexota bacterium]
MERDLVEYIAKNLVNHPDKVEIYTKRTRSAFIIKLHVMQGDMGRVIGKQGRVANAIRTLLKATDNDKKHNRVILEIN